MSSRADEGSGLKGGCSTRRLLCFDDNQPPSDELGVCAWCSEGSDCGAMQECDQCGTFFHIDGPCATNVLGFTVAPGGTFGDITCSQCASGSVSGNTATETNGNDDDDDAADDVDDDDNFDATRQQVLARRRTATRGPAQTPNPTF